MIQMRQHHVNTSSNNSTISSKHGIPINEQYSSNEYWKNWVVETLNYHHISHTLIRYSSCGKRLNVVCDDKAINPYPLIKEKSIIVT